MFNDARIDIYNYLYNLFYNVVTRNVYSMREPQDLTKSDTTNGFIVIRVGDFYDESEFSGSVYGWARCYVTAYIPPATRGRLDTDKFGFFEKKINEAIKQAAEDNSGEYQLEIGSVLSMDDNETTNANNTYYTFIKSFVVYVNNKE